MNKISNILTQWKQENLENEDKIVWHIEKPNKISNIVDMVGDREAVFCVSNVLDRAMGVKQKRWRHFDRKISNILTDWGQLKMNKISNIFTE